MKKILLSIVAIATLSLSTFGQAPEGFKYQAVLRDAGGLILNNQAVGMRLTIQQGSIGGIAVYTETFATVEIYLNETPLILENTEVCSFSHLHIFNREVYPFFFTDSPNFNLF